MPKKNSAFEFKDVNRHIKTPFEIYVYSNKMYNWMSHMLIIIACNYGYKLVCVDDKSSKPVQKYSRWWCCL